MARIDRQTFTALDQLAVSFSHEGQTFHIHPTPMEENQRANVAFVVVDGNNDCHGQIEGVLGRENEQLIFQADTAINAFSAVWDEGNPKHVRRVIATAIGYLAMRMKIWNADPELLPKGRQMYEYLQKQSLDPTSPLYGKLTVTPITTIVSERKMETFQITPTRRMS